MNHYELVIIGGGPAGLSAAVSAKRAGMNRILVLEREEMLGGILNQCIHNGFGLHEFHEELTGPEYAHRYIEMVHQLDISYKCNATVVDITKDKIVTYISPADGYCNITATTIILAMGCRERPRGYLNIPGFRPAGIYTAGTAQRLMNIDGYVVGKEVVILGSGDIGLIMARRLTLEGAHVKLVAEILPQPKGLARNIQQCLKDFHIPLALQTTVVDIIGKERVKGVVIAKVDGTFHQIDGTSEYISCDTLLLSVGLIPENELSRKIGISMNEKTNGPIVGENLETNVSGIFACGNVLHVHDLVDNVSKEAQAAGLKAYEYIQKGGV